MSAATRVVVRGRVQGVGYRLWTEERARALGLVGWVRNRSDGSVEAVLAGPDAGVAAMLAEMWTGPRSARVVAVEPGGWDGPVPPRFEVRATE